MNRRPRLPVTCSRCLYPATVLIEGGISGRYVIRAAVACGTHRPAVEKWAARAGKLRVSPVHQPAAHPQHAVQDSLFDL